MSGQLLVSLRFETQILGEVLEPSSLAPTGQISTDRTESPSRKVDVAAYQEAASLLSDHFSGQADGQPSERALRRIAPSIEREVRDLAVSLSLSLWDGDNQAMYVAAVAKRRDAELRRQIDKHLAGPDLRIVISHSSVQPGSLLLTGVVVVLAPIGRAIVEGAAEAVKKQVENAVDRGIGDAIESWHSDRSVAGLFAGETVTTTDAQVLTPPTLEEHAEPTANSGRATVITGRAAPSLFGSTGVVLVAVLLALILVVLFLSSFDVRRLDQEVLTPGETTTTQSS